MGSPDKCERLKPVQPDALRGIEVPGGRRGEALPVRGKGGTVLALLPLPREPGGGGRKPVLRLWAGKGRAAWYPRAALGAFSASWRWSGLPGKRAAMRWDGFSCLVCLLIELSVL